MNKILLAFCALALSASATQAQSSPRTPRARASGNATISLKPDQLSLNVGVVTQAVTALESSDLNAAQMAKMLSSLRQVLGNTGEIETINYSVSPVYQTTGGISTLTGYRTSNIVEARTGDLSLGGRLIDAATAGGANTVQSLRFGLKDPEPVRGEALRLAARQAKANATSIASGLGLQVGRVLLAEESSVMRPIADIRVSPGGTPTPLETGMVEVSASVVVEVELN